MKINYTLDTRNLNAALKVLSEHSKKAPAQLVNQTALFVIKKAQELTPVVSQGRIVSDMEVRITPVLSKKGSRKGLPLKSGKYKMTVSEYSAASLISLARMHPGSKYSMMTGNRWPLAKPNTKGNEAFWAYIKEAAERMVRARKSSTAFLKASWNTILYKLQAEVNKGRSGSRIDIEGNKSTLLSGEVIPAKSGSTFAVCVVQNTIGMNNSNDVLGEKYNQAAHRVLNPVLQRAIQSEFESKIQLLNRRGLLEKSMVLRPYGFPVK